MGPGAELSAGRAGQPGSGSEGRQRRAAPAHPTLTGGSAPAAVSPPPRGPPHTPLGTARPRGSVTLLCDDSPRQSASRGSRRRWGLGPHGPRPARPPGSRVCRPDPDAPPGRRIGTALAGPLTADSAGATAALSPPAPAPCPVAQSPCDAKESQAASGAARCVRAPGAGLSAALPPQTWTSAAPAPASTAAPASTSWGTSAACAQSPSGGPAARQVVPVPPQATTVAGSPPLSLPVGLGPARSRSSRCPAGPAGRTCPRCAGVAPPHLLSATETSRSPPGPVSPEMQAPLPAQGSLDRPPPSLLRPGQARGQTVGPGRQLPLLGVMGSLLRCFLSKCRWRRGSGKRPAGCHEPQQRPGAVGHSIAPTSSGRSPGAADSAGGFDPGSRSGPPA